MSDRRRARAAVALPSAHARTADAIRTPVRDPRWRDVLWLHEQFPKYVDRDILNRLVMGARVDHTIRARWALAHGYTDPDQAGSFDWRRFGPLVKSWREDVDTEP